jgi:hypothetical protein
MSATRYETREVLAAAYIQRKPTRMLTHTVKIGEVAPDGEAICNFMADGTFKMRVSWIAGASAMEVGGIDLPPTCRTCLARDPRFTAEQKKAARRASSSPSPENTP